MRGPRDIERCTRLVPGGAPHSIQFDPQAGTVEGVFSSWADQDNQITLVAAG